MSEFSLGPNSWNLFMLDIKDGVAFHKLGSWFSPPGRKTAGSRDRWPDLSLSPRGVGRAGSWRSRGWSGVSLLAPVTAAEPTREDVLRAGVNGRARTLLSRGLVARIPSPCGWPQGSASFPLSLGPLGLRFPFIPPTLKI